VETAEAKIRLISRPAIQFGDSLSIYRVANINGEWNMQLITKCLKDESGTEVIEYALMLGLIVVAALGIMAALGVKVVARWQSLVENL
jgi:pilus assembly protein Flp/PilA